MLTSAKIYSLTVLTLVLVILSSCTHDRSKLIEKRKYRSGWNVQRLTKLKVSTPDIAVSKPVAEVNFNKASREITDSKSTQPNTAVGIKTTNNMPTKSFSWLKEEESLNDFSRKKSYRKNEIVVSKPNHLESFKKVSEKKVPITTIGWVALILGFANLILFMWFPWIGMIMSLLCFVFAIKAFKVDYPSSRMLGLSSMFISAITFLVSFLITLVVMLNLQLFGI